MKNLKVGAKILLGFAIVIILMIVITGTVAVSSSTTIKNLGHIEADSALQTMGTDLVDAFYTARLNVKILIYIISDEAYAEATKSLALCGEIINDMRSHISENPILAKFLPQLDEVKKQLVAYSSIVTLVQKSNAELGLIESKLGALGFTLTQLSDELDNTHISILYDSTALNLRPGERIAQMDNLTDGAMISQGIWNMRNNADTMTGAGIDYKNYQTDLQCIDDTIALTEGSKSASGQIAELKTQLPMYKELIISFRDEMNRNKVLLENCTANGNTLLNNLNLMMYAIDDAMANQVTNTTATATTYLIVAMVVSVASIILAVFIALFIGRGIVKPINVMVSAADAIAAGNTDVDINYVSKDEIGKLSASFKHMIDTISDQVSAVESIADGDLSVEITPRGKDDKMGSALVKMIDNLSGMFGEVNASSAQVSAGSKQIAAGAQALAQGSAEQAAAVQQLSSSISEIAQKTKADAEMARELAQLAVMIRGNAETGTLQMDHMMEAVQDINQASHNISRIIKVIDDIAFQTNILALNAAVEAARAGHHGKGFAVVAEEVRNLAAKSAEAAKDTGNLISDSIEKAQLGSQIAEETSASLAEIVTGVNEAGQLMEDIVKSSEEQSAAIVQINTGVDQVAQVVQQNSATAQESAAASQEMSGQSDMLEELISRFRIKGSAPNNALGSPYRPKELSSPLKLGFSFSDYSDDFGKYGFE